jgi:protein subunit release factor B
MREKLFSITSKDFDWNYYRGSGKGGQHRNKTDSAVRCTHRESGAVATAQDERSQRLNKILAFKRVVETEKFQLWLKIQCAKYSLFPTKTETEEEMKERIEEEINNPKITKIEYMDLKLTEL